jgi:HAD superfamily hydrolase (TIGR01509 family)
VPVRWSAEQYRELVKIGGGKERMRTVFGDPDVVRQAGLPADADKIEAVLEEWHRYKTNLFTAMVDEGRIPPRSGVRRIATAASAAGWLLGVASTSAERSVRAVLRRVMGADLAEAFDPVVAGDMVARKKPSPDVYLMTCRVLGLQQDDVLVIEDSGVGSRAAHDAGLTAVITMNPLTADDTFMPSPLVVSCLGDPGGERAVVKSSRVGELNDGYVTLDDLVACLGHDLKAANP